MKKCDQCGADLDTRAPFGDQCSRCLFELGMDATEETDGSNKQIGAYTLLEELGQGGMGIVYLAQQSEPIQRQVALKIIKVGLDSEQVIARFETERQALAVMNHPNVAKVFDAGVTAESRPYFVMELVTGDPITLHCDRNHLHLADRLRLFTQACDAIQHAHQNGIIHRDVKPSNVLICEVDGKPQVKIIDFGVAKATTTPLPEETLFTEAGMLIGTPQYMSPEQANPENVSVDTRTDVYSLGVLLYELLTGVLPFEFSDLRRAGYESFLRTIREEDPPVPSRRVNELGDADRGRRLLGDLDWIAMKALEKDRSRRYGSPQDLAADIERYLTDQPVLASPPSTTYLAKKFVRRHTWGVAAAVVTVIVLISFAITMAIQTKRIANERDLAEQAKTDLERVVVFQSKMVSASDPEEMGKRLFRDLSDRVANAHRTRGDSEAEIALALTALEALLRGVNATDIALGVVDEDILGRAAETLDEEFADQPLIGARLRRTIGWTYRELGRYERAEPLLKATLEIRKRLLGDEHEQTLTSMNDLPALYIHQGRYVEAETLFLASLETHKRVLGDDHPDTLITMHNLATTYLNQLRFTEAEELFLNTLEARKRVLGNEHPSTLDTMNSLASAYLRQGRLDEAETLFLTIGEIRRRLLGIDDLETLAVISNLANVYLYQGRHVEAEPLYIETIEGFRRILGNDHPDTIFALDNLGVLYIGQGRYAETEAILLESLETKKQILGENHPETANTLYGLACLDALRGDPVKAMDWLRQAIDTGFTNGDWMAQDSDLETLHGVDFDALVKRAQENAAKQQAS